MALGAHDRRNVVIDAEQIARVVLPLDRDQPVVAFGAVDGAQFLRGGALPGAEQVGVYLGLRPRCHCVGQDGQLLLEYRRQVRPAAAGGRRATSQRFDRLPRSAP
jgi:hypothetical protein